LQSNFVLVSYTEEHTRELIVHFIVMAGQKGTAKKDLLRLIYCDQSTLYRITKKLEEEGVIRIVKKGQRTSYFAIQANVEVNTNMGASILGRSAIPKIFSGYRRILNEFTDDDYLEKTLLDFSSSIGAFITYVYVQSMNPHNRLLSPSGKEKVEEQEILTREWIHNGVSSAFLSRSLFEFKNMLFKALSGHNYVSDSFEAKINFTMKDPIIKNKKVAHKISKAFARLYPDMYTTLENILKDLPKKIDTEKAYERNIVEKWTTCIHEYGPVTNYNPFFPYPVRQCKNCSGLDPEPLETFGKRRRKRVRH
jgi:hypothetical protein